MRFLIICEFIGKNAPGIVFEKLILGLSKYHEVTVISTNAKSLNIKAKNIITLDVPKVQIPNKLVKFLFKNFSKNFFDEFWAINIKTVLNRSKLKSFDFIFSLISNYQYGPIVAGNLLSKKYGLKHLVYSVDGIPAPIGWLQDEKLLKAKIKFIKKELSKVDGFFSANEKMLKYQLNFFTPKAGFFSNVLYNPTDENILSKVNVKKDSVVRFVYAGGIYGPRKVTHILKAFEEYVNENKNTSFEFVGTSLEESLLDSLNSETRERIKIHRFTQDLSEYFQSATALIDIDADLEGDIFLSSKIINYLPIPRIIISETGSNSPSHVLFKNIPSIIQCGHNSDELLLAMRKVDDLSKSADYSDRKHVLAKFQIDNIVNSFNELLEKNI
jgi:glycosyltransferase involved in cell wall biosynthesis